jgi:hypothetical protein
MFPVRYDLGFYIQEDGILHSHRCENFKSYIICLSHVYKMYVSDKGRFMPQQLVNAKRNTGLEHGMEDVERIASGMNGNFTEATLTHSSRSMQKEMCLAYASGFIGQEHIQTNCQHRAV